MIFEPFFFCFHDETALALATAKKINNMKWENDNDLSQYLNTWLCLWNRQKIELEKEEDEKRMNWIQWSCKTIHIAYSSMKHEIPMNDTNNGDSNAIER